MAWLLISLYPDLLSLTQACVLTSTSIGCLIFTLSGFWPCFSPPIWYRCYSVVADSGSSLLWLMFCIWGLMQTTCVPAFCTIVNLHSHSILAVTSLPLDHPLYLDPPQASITLLVTSCNQLQRVWDQSEALLSAWSLSGTWQFCTSTASQQLSFSQIFCCIWT